MDFTVKIYGRLIDSIFSAGYQFQTFEDFLISPQPRSVILRHDVDKMPGNSLVFAKIQHSFGIKGTYFFRIVPQSFDERIIKEIHLLGHEIGYHYEDLVYASRIVNNIRNIGFKNQKNRRHIAEIAIESFILNLNKLRKIVPVRTICMHGSPLSRWDPRIMWEYFDYHNFDLIGEPYFDIDFSNVLYLTDTGRRWDGDSCNIRDKIDHNQIIKARDYNIKTTTDIIDLAKSGRLPARIMMTFHPQRWSDSTFPWVKEFFWQNFKNIVKFAFKKKRKIG